MSNGLLRVIEQQLAKRGLAGAAITPDTRLQALNEFLVQASRSQLAKGQLEILERLFENSCEKNPQFAEWADQYEIENPPIPERTAPTPNPGESQRAMHHRQQREAGERTEPVLPLARPQPAPPEGEWYASGRRPGLGWANQLKRVLGPRPNRGDGSWMWNR